ncbi:MAG TPA: hypothetical protein DEQ34_11300 [Balneolaceae bacterium]|nr:hypothetical protein [Balneolaceae bacterium]|tara:strand:+ start:116207 stop:116548 length:342 start_codon:yes stop_codon:yes gene_type:complete
MSSVLDYFPKAEGDEALYLGKLISTMSEDDLRKFANAYNSRRKDPQLILFTCLLAFLGVAGIHRILLNQVGMGILYLLTGGLCLIGAIVDIVNYKDLTFQYNRSVAQELKTML